MISEIVLLCIVLNIGTLIKFLFNQKFHYILNYFLNCKSNKYVTAITTSCIFTYNNLIAKIFAIKYHLQK